MSQRRMMKKRVQRHLTDQEILEWFLERFTIPSSRVAKEREAFLKFPFIATPAACFVVLGPLIGWVGVIPFWYWGTPIAINAVLLTIFGLYVYFTSKKLEEFISQEQLVHFIGAHGLWVVSWMGFYASLMLLLASIGAWMRIHRILWWVPLLVFGISGIGLWLGRKAILRAIVEGPEAHPWFWPIWVFFAIPLGFWIFLTGALRFIVGWERKIDPDAGLLFFTISMLGISILLLGMAMIGGIIGYLHYQRWSGAEKLKV